MSFLEQWFLSNWCLKYQNNTKYTAFNCAFGTFKFLRLPMVLKQSPTVHQLLIDFTWKHLHDIDEVLSGFEQTGLKPAKCKFAVEKEVFLGHETGSKGLHPPLDKRKVIRHYLTPTTRKEFERALGLFNWFRQYFANLVWSFALLLIPVQRALDISCIKFTKVWFGLVPKDCLNSINRMAVKSWNYLQLSPVYLTVFLTYEGDILWLAILQQFHSDIEWKSARNMVVADSLSRTIHFHEQLLCSPVENDTCFSDVPEKPTNAFPQKRSSLHEIDKSIDGDYSTEVYNQTSQKAVTELHESTCLSSPVSSDIPYLESPTTSSVSEHQAVAQNVAFQELNMTSASIRKRYVVSLVCVEERKNKSSASYTMIYYYLVMVEYKTLLIVSRNTNTLQSLLMLFANILGDLYGHVSCTLRGHSFLLTAFDMFSKFIYIKPFVNKDAMSVSEVLMVMFTHYGVCDTLISDQGYELIAKVTSELCSFLCVPQQFTPNIEHQCLGACERIHRTLAATLAPYMNDYLNNWDFLVNAIMFSMNNAVNSSTGYSPFEIVLA
ncbi:POL4-like protein [Mya arenaria]|uniref:POL4-like protein n=1 Tax=Mya arenaria TaxID=6604 RepID=A0ABY7EVR6_MYAAR|nr:POL4-like protein [Mya arenaria]